MTRVRTGRWGFQNPARTWDFSILLDVHTGSTSVGPIQSRFHWKCRTLSRGKWPGHEAESSYPSNTGVKNDWSCAISASINAFLACIGKTFFFYCALFPGTFVYCWHRRARFTELRLWKESTLPNLQVYNPVGYICEWEASESVLLGSEMLKVSSQRASWSLN